MTSEQILLELGNYLTDAEVEELRLNHSLKNRKNPGTLVLCMTISDIIKNYNSTEENEKTVALLLCDLCNIHFSKK